MKLTIFVCAIVISMPVFGYQYHPKSHSNYNPSTYTPQIKENALWGNPSRRSYPHGHNDGNDNRSYKGTSSKSKKSRKSGRTYKGLPCAGEGCTGKFSKGR